MPMPTRREFIALAAGAGLAGAAGATAADTAAAARPSTRGRRERKARSLLISGATVIDGSADKPIEGQSVLIEGSRIKALGRRDELPVLSDTRIIDAQGKYVIPGLMNANVHLLADARLENLMRYAGRWEELIAEAAQVALKSGQTTVFDTYGPRRYLMTVRDRIAAGETVGSRIFCAGNIIGLDGPYSADFLTSTAEVASSALVNRVNAIWVENVGRRLMWLTPERVAQEVRVYIEKGIDFIKYASNDHVPGAFLAFSLEAQTAMVEEAHRAGLTAQAHTMSVEGLRIAIEAGCDIIQHPNITGPEPIPERTLESFARHKAGAAVFPITNKAYEHVMKTLAATARTMWSSADINVRNLIRSGAPLLLANDGAVFPPEFLTDPLVTRAWSVAPGEDNSIDLAKGHFYWFQAMEEKGCPPMEMLRAATRNIAVAYRRDKDLGTLEAGKIADVLILDRNPLQAAANYRSIHMILKEGEIIDRDALPATPMLTKPMEPPIEEERSYIPFLSKGR